jgi:hypothetical protein
VNTPDDEGGKSSQLQRSGKIGVSSHVGLPDSLILLLMGIKEQSSMVDVHLLSDTAIYEVVRLSSVHTELRDEYIRILIRKYRQK